MTPEGQQALSIAEWAWQDPAGRVSQAQARIAQMALSATGQAAIEIGDAATMLSRLAGTLEPEPETISAQLTNGTVIGQIIELGRSTAWMHEARDHGRFTSAGDVASAMRRQESAHASRLRRMQAMQQRAHATASATARTHEEASRAVASRISGPSKAAAVDAAARKHLDDPAVVTLMDNAVAAKASQKPLDEMSVDELMKTPPERFGPQEAHALTKAQYEQELHPPHAEHAESLMQRVHDEIQKLKTEMEQADTATARRKMIVEGSIGIAGLVLGLILLGIGAPPAAAILAAFAGTATQVGVERKMKLANDYQL